MKRIVSSLIFAGLVGGSAFVMWGAQGKRGDPAAQQRVTVTRMFTRPDGLTDIENVEVPLSQVIKVAGVQFNRVKFEPASAQDPRAFEWHTAPHSRYVVTLSGKAIIEVSGGNKTITADRDHIILADDVTGKGHRYTAHPVGPEDWVTIFIEVNLPQPQK